MENMILMSIIRMIESTFLEKIIAQYFIDMINK